MAQRDPRGLSRMRLDFSKGLQQAFEDSVVPNGYAPRIENWVPLPTGALRVRTGWANGGTGGPGTPNVLGLAYQADYGRFIVLHTTGATIAVYKTAAAAPTGNLSSISTIAGAFTRWVTMAMGQHTLAFGGPELLKLYGVNQAGALVDSGANAVPQYVMALTYHHNAFYAGGGKDLGGTSIPYRLFYTDPGDGALGAWPVNNFIDIGDAAGGTINALATFRDELLIGKSDSLWLLIGTPDDTLDLHRLDVGNAMPGNSICPTPYGAVIAGYDAIYLFDGGTVQRISRPIQTDYQSLLSQADVAYFDGKVYIGGASITRIWVFDFETGAWTTETPAESIWRLFSYVDSSGVPWLTGGTTASATARAVVHKASATSYAGDMSGWTESFALRTPEYWVDGPEAPAAFRYLDLRLRQRGGDASQTGLSVKPTVRNTEGVQKVLPTQVIRPIGAAGVFAHSVLIPKVTGYGVSFEITQALPSTDATLFDIEEAVLLYQPAGLRLG